jgi:hypothetical protein
VTHLSLGKSPLKLYFISLAADLNDIRTYEDPHGIYYPKSTKTLIVIEKDSTELTFPFDMHLSPKMFVDIHGKHWAERLVGLGKRPNEGWTFHFTGNYERTAAKNAVMEMGDAEDSNDFTPRICGLRAAAVQYLQNLQDRPT